MAHTENKQDSCSTVLMARDPNGDIRYCSHCGVFHVNIDAFTLRFRATALMNLWSALGTALENYRRYISQQGAASRVRLGDDIH